MKNQKTIQVKSNILNILDQLDNEAQNSLALAYSYNNIGNSYENKGDKKSAEAFYAKAKSIEVSLEKAQNNIKPNNYKQLQDNQNQH